MSFANQATGQKFPFSYDRVFDELIETLPKVGFKIEEVKAQARGGKEGDGHYLVWVTTSS